ncbi:MAG TPA: hypothetical protein PK156_01655 [Polyangium sp.]|nr:hypothetical protein [Polyangium sp.]
MSESAENKHNPAPIDQSRDPSTDDLPGDASPQDSLPPRPAPLAPTLFDSAPRDTPDPAIQNAEGFVAPAPALAPVEAPHTSATIPMAPLGADAPVGLLGNEKVENRATSKVLARAGAVARQAGILLALGASIFVFLWQVNQHYPIKHWLFWSYLKQWGYCSLFVSAIVSSGHLVLRALGGKRLPLVERTTISLATGTLVFFLVMFACGLFGIYNRVFAIAMPVLLTLPGLPGLVRHWRRASRHLQGARKRTTWRPSPLFWLVAAFGAAGVGLIYFAILSARNIAYDSYFYHLGISQQYALEGGIKPALEGWLPAAIPHLASVLYCWAFLLPGMTMFERVTCAAHVEFILFLFTLAGVPALVRQLVPRAPAGLSWATFFLFPGIFVYDSALSVAADHVAAFWAIPIYLMLLRTLRSLDVVRTEGAFAARNSALLGAFSAGAVLTKYQSMYLIAYPGLALCCAMVWQFGRVAIRHRAMFRRVVGTIFATAFTSFIVGLLLTTPHWLKNWAWYGDPFFPYMSPYMLSSKWVPDTSALFQGWNDTQHQNWRPQGTLSQKLLETLQGVVVFAFKPHDWAKFHGQVPIFGALCTLSVVVLPFLRKTGRIWGLVIATHLGVAVWYWTLHQDRYLQLLLPWMACIVSATLFCLWRAHWTAKPLTAVLVGVQVIWGGDAYFIPAHAMTGSSAGPITAELLSSGMKAKYAERFAFGDRLFEMGRDAALPQDARVLVHEHELRFGLWRPVVSDRPGLTYAYRYEFLKDDADVYAHMRKLGVTHVATRLKSNSVDSLGAELRFFSFVKRETKHIKDFSDWSLFSLPPTPPTRKVSDVVAYLGCGKQYARGLHQLSNLSVRERQVVKKPPLVVAMKPMPTQPQEFAAFIAQAGYVVTDNNCKPAAPPEATVGFTQVATRGDGEVLWVRSQ